MKSGLWARSVMGIAALGIAVGGVAYAAGGSGTITVCVHKSGGGLYKAKKCKRHDKTLSWNKQGVAGRPGAPGPITGTLPSGVTLRGSYIINQPVSAGGLTASTGISFGLQLSAAPTVHYIAAGGQVPTGCSGSASNPGAASGNLCIFEDVSANGSGSEFNPLTNNSDEATKFGAAVRVVSALPGAFNTEGTWAVTG